MKYIIYLALFISSTTGNPPPQYRKPIPAPYKPTDLQTPNHATILQQDYIQENLGSYNFGYQTSDGVQREEKAEIKNAGSENEALVVQGSYSYIGNDGVTYTVKYIADENGFRPIGQHIPSV